MNIIKWGSEFIIASDMKPCMMCGRPTSLIDIFAEGRICSEKCSKDFNMLLWRAEQEFIEAEQYCSWKYGCTSEEWFEFLSELDMKK